MSRKAMAVATMAGVVLGVAYTLSPLTVWWLFGFALLCRISVRDLTAEERRVVLTLIIVAAVLRLAVVAGLFVATDHGSIPFGSLFGDEEYFKRRSLWLRSMALDVNISVADRVYAIDEYSDTSYLYLLAFIQILVGSAPYGAHVFSILLYLVGAVILHRFVRRTFGSAPATLSLTLVLFLPSLFLWSVSALRESIHFLLTTVGLVGGVELLRWQPWRRRIAWAAAALAALVALRDLRAGSMAAVGVALVIGVAASTVVGRPKRLAAAVLLTLVAGGVALSRPAIQHELMSALRSAALTHQGHVFTPGLHYKLLDPAFYVERHLRVMDAMTAEQGIRFVTRAVVAMVIFPLPWQAETRLTQAYLPEQLVWYGLVLLFPCGVYAVSRYDQATAFVFTAYIVLTGLGIAIRSGNVGTLIRHRGLMLPFLMCLAAVAMCRFVARTTTVTEPHAIGNPVERTV